MDLVLPRYDTYEVPKWFQRRLVDIDPALVCYWNRFRQRFVIDRCKLEGHQHSPSTCERANVMVLETPEGGMLPPCEAALEQLKANDTWEKYGSLEKMMTAIAEMEAERETKRKRDIRDKWRGISQDNRRQLKTVVDLINTHDVRPSDLARSFNGLSN